MAVSTIIFDFDGTLHDSMHIYPRAFQAGYDLLVREGWAEARTFADDDIAGYIGLTAEEMWKSFRPDLPDDVWPRAAAEVGRAMDSLIADGTARMFPGVPEMLQRVVDMGLTCVFLSNCRVDYQNAARRAFGLDRFFSGYYNAEEYKGIPKEDIFPDIAERFSAEYVMVGDRYKDLNVARKHGLASVGCAYGYGQPDEYADATEVARTPADIADCIARIVASAGE